MDQIDIRTQAINVAQGLEHWGMADALIKNAASIEDYLYNGYKNPNKKELADQKSGYFKITHPIKGLIPFNFYNHQKILWTGIDNSKTLIVNSARQMGSSSLLSLYAIKYALRNSESKIRILSSSYELSKNIIHKFSNQIKEEIASTNDVGVTFTNGSVITCDDRDTTGTLYDMAIIDNAAYLPYKNDDKIHEFIKLNVKDKCVILSSPEFNSGLFYSYWTSNDSFISKLMLPWYIHEEYDLAWAEKMRKDRGSLPFETEYCCQFYFKF